MITKSHASSRGLCQVRIREILHLGNVMGTIFLTTKSVLATLSMTHVPSLVKWTLHDAYYLPRSRGSTLQEHNLRRKGSVAGEVRARTSAFLLLVLSSDLIQISPYGLYTSSTCIGNSGLVPRVIVHSSRSCLLDPSITLQSFKYASCRVLK